MPAGYLIASVTVTNPAQYEEYRKWSSEAMRVHGAEVLVRGGAVEVLEGDWNPGRTSRGSNALSLRESLRHEFDRRHHRARSARFKR